MTQTGVDISERIESQLSAVASNLHKLANEQTATRTELSEFKERLLAGVESLEGKVERLEEDNKALVQRVAALESRQAPLTAPAAWVAIIISAVVAARDFFGA